MTQLHLRRFYQDSENSIGKLYVNGEFECFTLEDQVRPNGIKVDGETAIPYGTYKCGIHPNKQGRFRLAYIKRWGDPFNAGAIEIKNVPNFTDVLIHTGVDDSHTAGCLLVGRKVTLDKDEECKLQESRKAYFELYHKIYKAAENGTLTIEIGEEMDVKVGEEDDFLKGKTACTAEHDTCEACQ